jgi:hypothetical protein
MFSGVPSIDFGDPDDKPQSPGCGGCLLMLAVLFGVLVLALLGGALAIYPVLFVSRWPRFARAIQPLPIRAAIVLGMCGVGGLLYLARRYFRLYYGMFECCVGAATLWAAVSRPDVDRFALALGLMGGIYVIVRGLDNMAQAKAPKEVRVGRFRVGEDAGKITATDTKDDSAPVLELQVTSRPKQN